MKRRYLLAEDTYLTLRGEVHHYSTKATSVVPGSLIGTAYIKTLLGSHLSYRYRCYVVLSHEKVPSLILSQQVLNQNDP